jgi:multidrug efflux pump subunit AcrA (membrane-fusion protein)
MTLRRRGPTLVVVAVVALAVAVTAGYALRRGGVPKPVASSTAPVVRGTVTVTASAAGTVSMVQTRGLSFGTTGTVTELDVKVGDQVAAGQVLARIDATDAQSAVDAAQRQLDSAETNLSKAQAPTPTPTCAAVAPVALTTDTGPSPSTGASAGPSPRPSASPRPSPSRGAATGRASCAVNTGGGTPGRGGGTDPLASAQRQVNNAELALLQAQRQLAGTVITAPLAGRVISVGGILGAQERPGGTGFVVLGNVADTEVRAQFSESDVAHLAVGQTASVTLADRSQPYPGKVAEISPAGTVSGWLVRYGVLIAFDSVPPDLLFGQSASVAVTTARADAVLSVPSSAVHDVRDGTATVTVRADGRDTPRPVTIGLRGDRYTEIRSGLTEGEQVVL